MKFFKAATYVVVLVTLSSSTKLQAAPYPVIDDLLAQRVIVPQATNADDYLIELARNADVNVLADATDWPKTSALAPFPETSVAIYTHEDGTVWNQVREPRLLNLIVDLMYQQKLSHLRYGNKTFLFWRKPAIASELEQARKLAANLTGQIDQQLLDEPRARQLKAQTSLDLATYFQHKHGWNGGTPEAPLTDKFTDLPEDLRHNLTTLALMELRGSQVGWSFWFGNAAWKDASLQIRNTNARDGDQQRTQMLVVATRVKGEPHLISINMR